MEASGRHSRWPAPLAVVALGLLAYTSAFPAAFVFDDGAHIPGNELLEDPASYLPGGAGYRAQPGRALCNLTFALGHGIHGPDPDAFRATNVVLHLANALLLHALVLLAFRTPRLRSSRLAPASRAVALAAALLFVAHPLQTQAVSYVVQRYASLATGLYLLAIVLYARWRLERESGGARGLRGAAGYAPVVVVAVLAMKSKEIAFTLPVAAALFEAAFFEGSWRRRLLHLAPLLVTLAVIPLALLGRGTPLGEVLSDVAEVTRVQSAESRWGYLLTQVPVVATYLRLLAFPAGQNVDHDFPRHGSLAEPRVAASLLVLGALAAGAAWLYRASGTAPLRRKVDPAARLVSFGVAWFFLALLVESSVIPIVDVIFEHRVYLPSAGLLAAAATALALVASRLAPARAPSITVAAGLALSLALATVTWRRNAVWRSEEALWADAVSKSPAKPRPHQNLGVALGWLGRDAEALHHLREAVRLDPRYARAHDNLGVLLSRMGRAAEAEAAFLTAVRLAPDDAEARYNLGSLRLEEGRYAEAAALLERALALRPGHRDAHVNLAAAYNALGRHAEAARLLEGASAAVRRRPESHLHLGLAHFHLGNPGAANREAEVLDGLSPEMAAALRAYMARGGGAAR